MKKIVSLSAVTLFAFVLTFAGCEKKETPAPPHRHQHHRRNPRYPVPKAQLNQVKQHRLQIQRLTKKTSRKLSKRIFH